MNVFKSKNENRGGGNPPSSQEHLTNSLVASIWQKEKDGKLLFWWDMARKGRDNGKTYVTKHPEHLLECPEFIAKLSEAFANCSAVDEKVRERLLRQSAFLYQLAQTNFDEAHVENGQASNGLSFAA